MSENIEWGPEFRGSEEISKVLNDEFGDHNSYGWQNSLKSLSFSYPKYKYRLPVDHWFYQHPLFISEKPAPKQPAPRKLDFSRCARGFNLYDSFHHKIYAFGKIEDLAAWLVEQYGDVSKPVKVGMSACNKCGAEYPTAPTGVIHKCGRCSGGYCSPVC